MEIKYYFILLLMIIVSSCKENVRQAQISSESYFYKITYKDTSRIDYSYRVYEYVEDTIKVVAYRYNAKGNEINNPGEDGFYLKSNNKLYLLKGKKSSPILGEIVFNPSLKDSCSSYFHPYYHQIRNCYRGLTADGKEFIFTSEQQAADGISRILYLDKNYTLLRETSDSPTENFREMIKVDKSKIPYEVLKNIH